MITWYDIIKLADSLDPYTSEHFKVESDNMLELTVGLPRTTYSIHSRTYKNNESNAVYKLLNGLYNILNKNKLILVTSGIGQIPW